MNVAEALSALTASQALDFQVVVLRRERDVILAAAVLGVALDDESDDVSLLMGEFLEEDAALEAAVSVGEVREGLEELLPGGAEWPVFSTAVDDPTGGGSLVGSSVDAEIELFAFLQGPVADWEDD